MKKLELVVKPFKLDAIKEALMDLGIDGMTASEVRGLRTAPHAPNAHPEPDYVPRIKLEIIVPDELLQEVATAVQLAASDQEGSRLIGPAVFILPVDRTVRIRTGEKSA